MLGRQFCILLPDRITLGDSQGALLRERLLLAKGCAALLQGSGIGLHRRRYARLCLLSEIFILLGNLFCLHATPDSALPALAVYTIKFEALRALAEDDCLHYLGLVTCCTWLMGTDKQYMLHHHRAVCILRPGQA